ncbi:hypothetical protein Tco_0594033 [Tanacetum coccineum]
MSPPATGELGHMANFRPPEESKKPYQEESVVLPRKVREMQNKRTVMKAENTLKRKDLNPRLSYSQNHPFQVPPEGQASKEHQKVGGRASRTGFDDLDPKSMDSYEELSQKLLEEFSQKKVIFDKKKLGNS